MMHLITRQDYTSLTSSLGRKQQKMESVDLLHVYTISPELTMSRSALTSKSDDLKILKIKWSFSLKFKFIPENFWSNKHQDVMNDLIKRADEKVWSKGFAESAEERRLAGFLSFDKQNLWLFYWLSIFLFSLWCSFWGVECFLYGPDKKKKNQNIKTTDCQKTNLSNL